MRDLKAALALDPSNADSLLLLSNCYLISGRVPLARALVARLLSVDPLTPLSRCLPGFADLMEGHFAAAVEPYRQMFEVERGFINYPFLARHDPFFETLRSDPRFQRVLQDVRDRWERFEGSDPLALIALLPHDSVEECGP